MKTAALILVLLMSAGLAYGQQDHAAAMNERGDHVMGFSHDKTTHHFELNQDGGLIEVRVNDSKDTASLDMIRSHFQHIAKMFAAGNFNAPMLVHGQAVPGTATMTRLKDDIHWELSEIPRGAQIKIVADNKEASDAIHELLHYQIAYRKTGDCPSNR